MQGTDRILDREVDRDETLLDHRENQRGRAQLEVGRDLRQIGIADDHVQAAIFLRVGVGLVAGIDDRALERGLEPDLDLEEVGTLADLEAVLPAVLAQSDPPGAGYHLPADEERRQVAHDVGERRCPRHQVVFVAPVGSALVVGVVLVELDRLGTRDGSGVVGRHLHDPLTGFVPDDGVSRIGAFRSRILRMRMVDIEPGAIGQNDVGQADVLVRELTGVGELSRKVEAPRVTQRILFLEIPARTPSPRGHCRVGIHHLG
jgi:hypothetical protein